MSGARIGKPQKALPPPGQMVARRTFWGEVADAAKQAPGQWVPVHLDGADQMPAKPVRMASIIRTKPRAVPAALRDPGFTAQARDGVLYVSWSPA